MDVVLPHDDWHNDDETTPLICRGFIESYQRSRHGKPGKTSPDGSARTGTSSKTTPVGSARPQASSPCSARFGRSARGAPALPTAAAASARASARVGSPRGAHARAAAVASSARASARAAGSRTKSPPYRQRNSTDQSSPHSTDSSTASSTRHSEARFAVPASSQWHLLTDIRSANGGECIEEQAIPKMPPTCLGFHSTAHLRDKDYWRVLLDQDDLDQGSCAWVEAKWYETIVAVGIVGSALVLCVVGTQAALWHWWVHQLLLLPSCLESAVLLLRFQRGWRPRASAALTVRALDGVVTLGVVLLQAAFFIAATLRSGVKEDLGFAVHLLSLLRLVRLVYIVPGLHELSLGIRDAFRALFWVLALMFLVLYATAVVCTQLIGRAELGQIIATGDTADSEEVEEVKSFFSGVFSSLFLMFQIMSAWSLEPLFPLFAVSPLTQLFFSLFFIYAGWTLLAVLTGTVSFTMIALRTRIVGEDLAREEQRRLQVTDELKLVFEGLDADGSGDIRVDELDLVLQLKEIRQLLLANTNVTPEDLSELFTWIDTDQSGAISWEEFIHGFKWLNDAFQTKSLLRLREKLTKDTHALLQRLQTTFRARFSELQAELEAPAKKFHALSEQVQMLHSRATDVHRGLEASRALCELETRLSEQIDLVVNMAEHMVDAQSMIGSYPLIPISEGMSSMPSVIAQSVAAFLRTSRGSSQQPLSERLISGGTPEGAAASRRGESGSGDSLMHPVRRSSGHSLVEGRLSPARSDHSLVEGRVSHPRSDHSLVEGRVSHPRSEHSVEARVSRGKSDHSQVESRASRAGSVLVADPLLVEARGSRIRSERSQVESRASRAGSLLVADPLLVEARASRIRSEHSVEARVSRGKSEHSQVEGRASRAGSHLGADPPVGGPCEPHQV